VKRCPRTNQGTVFVGKRQVTHASDQHDDRGALRTSARNRDRSERRWRASRIQQGDYWEDRLGNEGVPRSRRLYARLVLTTVELIAAPSESAVNGHPRSSGTTAGKSGPGRHAGMRSRSRKATAIHRECSRSIMSPPAVSANMLRRTAGVAGSRRIPGVDTSI